MVVRRLPTDPVVKATEEHYAQMEEDEEARQRAEDDKAEKRYDTLNEEE